MCGHPAGGGERTRTHHVARGARANATGVAQLGVGSAAVPLADHKVAPGRPAMRPRCQRRPRLVSRSWIGGAHQSWRQVAQARASPGPPHRKAAGSRRLRRGPARGSPRASRLRARQRACGRARPYRLQPQAPVGQAPVARCRAAPRARLRSCRGRPVRNLQRRSRRQGDECRAGRAPGRPCAARTGFALPPPP
eukprot:scaffold55865_cov61-Phaeocystis_antarctica.AAC.9